MQIEILEFLHFQNTCFYILIVVLKFAKLLYSSVFDQS